METPMIECPKCGELMPLLRRAKFGYDFCVKCSNVGVKRGIPVQMGSGDHTWTETIIMEENDFYKYTNQNNPNNTSSGIDIEEEIEIENEV